MGSTILVDVIWCDRPTVWCSTRAIRGWSGYLSELETVADVEVWVYRQRSSGSERRWHPGFYGGKSSPSEASLVCHGFCPLLCTTFIFWCLGAIEEQSNHPLMEHIIKGFGSRVSQGRHVMISHSFCNSRLAILIELIDIVGLIFGRLDLCNSESLMTALRPCRSAIFVSWNLVQMSIFTGRIKKLALVTAIKL